MAFRECILNNKIFLCGILLQWRSPINSTNALAINRGTIHSSPDFRRDSKSAIIAFEA
jgi:hypothetical protein